MSAYPSRPTYPDRVAGHGRQPPHQRDGGGAAPIIINPPATNNSEVLEALRGLPAQMAQAVNRPVMEDPRASAMSMMVQEQLAKVNADQKALVDNFSRLSSTVAQQQHKAELDERLRHSAEQVQQLTRMVESLASKSSSQPSERLIHELKHKDQEIKRLSSIIEKAVESQNKQPKEAPQSLDLVGQQLALSLQSPATPQTFFPLPSPSAPPPESEALTPRTNPFDMRSYLSEWSVTR